MVEYLDKLVLAAEHIEPEVFQTKPSNPPKQVCFSNDECSGKGQKEQSFYAFEHESSFSSHFNNCTSPVAANVAIQHNKVPLEWKRNMEDPKTIEVAVVKKKRNRLKPDQVAILKGVFKRTAFPTAPVRESLGRQLGMSARAIQVWFQNRRQNYKDKIMKEENDDDQEENEEEDEVVKGKESDNNRPSRGLGLIGIRKEVVVEDDGPVAAIEKSKSPKWNQSVNVTTVSRKVASPFLSPSHFRNKYIGGIKNQSEKKPVTEAFDDATAVGDSDTWRDVHQASPLIRNSPYLQSPTDSAVNLYSPELRTLSGMFENSNSIEEFSSGNSNNNIVAEQEENKCIPSKFEDFDMSTRIPTIQNLLNPMP